MLKRRPKRAPPRPRAKPGTPVKDIYLKVRVDPELHARIRKYADLHKLNISELIRGHLEYIMGMHPEGEEMPFDVDSIDFGDVI